MKTRLVTLLAILTAAFVGIGIPMPLFADGFVVVNCPPVGIAPDSVGGGSVMPMPNPTDSGFPQVANLPPFGTPQPPGVLPAKQCFNYLSVKSHRVTVTIQDQVAMTRVSQVFVNESKFQLEGTYLFPLPEDAAINGFSMWVDGKRMDGRILDKNQARSIYEDIVRRQRDPALLEYIGKNAFQARIFPIAPHAEKQVEIEYSQVLVAENGLVHYVYSLNTEKFSPRALRDVSISVAVRSKIPIRSVYSPSHDISVSREGDYAVKIGYEAHDVKPDRDFDLYYSLTDEPIDVNLLSFREAGDDGFFLLIVDPELDVKRRESIAKDVILILDTSGSMQGAKIDQAKRSLGYILGRLEDEDRFNIISFSTGVSKFAASLQPVSEREAAKRFVDKLRAEGSTDIQRALEEGISSAGTSRPTYIIFITDGLPTTGETNSSKIVSSVLTAGSKNLRLFTMGLGDDVNTVLLDTLSQKLHGASSYVRPGERADEAVSSLYAKIASPVLADVSIDWGGRNVYDVYPYPLPDLFLGSQLIVLGRYRDGGTTTVTLQGTVNGVTRSLKYSDLALVGTAKGSTSSLDDALPRLWATRKIGYLLSQIRLNGESKEAVNSIVALAVRYGIMTPYTSFLIDERSDVLTETGRGGAAKDLSKSFNAPGGMPTSGGVAVQQSQLQSDLRSASVAPVVPTPSGKGSKPDELARIRYVGAKTFLERNGVWVDTLYDREKMATRKIEFGSDAYFELLFREPELARYMAVARRVIVVIGTNSFEVTDDGSGTTKATQTTYAAGVREPTSGANGPASSPVPGVEVAVDPSNLQNRDDTGIVLLGTALFAIILICMVFLVKDRIRLWLPPR